MKVGSAFVGYYILALLLLNLVNVSKCSDESNEEDAEDEDVTHEEESEEDEVIDDEEEDETDPKSVKSTDLEEYESMISSRDFRVSIPCFLKCDSVFLSLVLNIFNRGVK